MGLLGQIWVKLGLKSDDFNRGLDEGEDKAKGFGEKLKGFGIGWVAALTAVGVAVKKIISTAIEQTQTWGDAWQRNMAGLKAAYNTFVAGLSTGEGWKELMDNIKAASDAAREAADELDELFERKNSYNVQVAKLENDIAAAQLIYSDTSKSDEERIAAANLVIEKNKELGALKQTIADQEYEATKKNFEGRTQLNDSETEFLVDEYNKNRDIILQAREYTAERKKLQKAVTVAAFTGGDKSAELVIKAEDELAKFEKATPQSIKDVAELTNKYDRANDAIIKAMVDSRVAQINVQGDIDRSNRRANTSLGAIKASIADNNAAENKAAADEQAADAGLISSKQKQIELLTKKRDLAKDPATIGAINDEIDALNKELEVLKHISTEAQKSRQNYKENPLEDVPERASSRSGSSKSDVYFKENVLIGKAYAQRKEMISKELQAERSAEKEYMAAQLKDREKSLDSMLLYYSNMKAKAVDISMDFDKALQSGVIASLEELGTALGSQDADYSQVLSALISPLAKAAIEAGVLIMTTGSSLEAIKDAFANLFGGGPAVAIAAGAALIAVGVGLSAGAAAIASGKSSSSSTSSGNSSYSGGYGVYGVHDTTRSYSAAEIKLSGEFKVKGQDLQLALNNYNNSRRR